VILAQLTDPHVLEPGEEQFLDNNAMLAEAIDSLNAERPRPDVVVGSGDLTNWARAGQYAELTELIGHLDLPFLPMVGNHDDRDGMRKTFPDTPWADAEHASWVTDVDGITLVGLDTTDPGQHGGAFDEDRRTWLEASLDSSSGPVILILHHPPFDTHVGWMDEFGFSGVDDLRRVIAEHPSLIMRILCGHLHRPVVTTVAGVTTSVCLSTVHHVALDLGPESEPALIRDPRGYQLHVVDAHGVVSHTRYIDTGETAFDPGWD
jgi:3',5'-cyclic-AMP phosphodiesterase